MSSRTSLLASWSAGLAALLMVAVPANSIARAETVEAPSRAADAVATSGAFRHLRALQEIATANGGNRAAGTPGYDRSAEYIADRLKEAGYRVRFEEFEFQFFEERSPAVLNTIKSDQAAEAAPASAVRTMAYSGSGSVTAPLRAVNLKLDEAPVAASASGCEAADFQDFERGAVALVRRGTCPFQVKVDHAAAAGAAGVIVMNEGTQARTDAFSGTLTQAPAIPVVGVPFEFGRSLAATVRSDGGVTVRLVVDAVTGKRSTRNVLADTNADSGGSPIVVGAHLDSVPEGPGINDNGSGSAAVLEAALQLAQAPAAARGRVRFAFWSAEERGLLGSRHHLDALSDDERRQIALYVNLDMVGSPNFNRTLRDSGETRTGLAGVMRRELLAEFSERHLPFDERDAGRFGSDDASFSRKGIATLGLSTGASGAKSESQAGRFGGVAGRPFDACYHKACDTLDNIDRDLLEDHTRALVRALRAAAAMGQRD
jgi:Zn-dependent M28 family amino/carboxypeptidase